MSTKYYVHTSRAARHIDPKRPSGGHILAVDTGLTYKGLGLKDLKRRHAYWEGRVADFAALSADAVGPAKTKANKLLKSGHEILKAIANEMSKRQAV